MLMYSTIRRLPPFRPRRPVLSSFSRVSPFGWALHPRRSNGLGGTRLGLGSAWSLSLEKLESTSVKRNRSGL